MPPSSVVPLALPTSYWMLPPDTVAPSAVPPALTYCTPALATVADVSVPSTISAPPSSLVPLAVPLSYWMPPLDTVALSAVPPTSSRQSSMVRGPLTV
jgi:hypothetical protein